ncbi:MAG TPA: SIS domain-containing protein, partial [Candidatus Eisenbacteria bacterium]
MSPRRIRDRASGRRRGAGPAARRAVDWDALRERLDRDGMGDRIESVPAMLKDGVQLTAPALRRIEPQRPRRLVLAGMGGSAIAGDLLRVWADREGTIPVHVCRHYEPPAWVTPEDFLVFSSYSGETEETLAAYAACRPLGARACVLTSGGTLERRARSEGLPCLSLPPGHPP